MNFAGMFNVRAKNDTVLTDGEVGCGIHVSCSLLRISRDANCDTQLTQKRVKG